MEKSLALQRLLPSSYRLSGPDTLVPELRRLYVEAKAEYRRDLHPPDLTYLAPQQCLDLSLLRRGFQNTYLRSLSMITSTGSLKSPPACPPLAASPALDGSSLIIVVLKTLSAKIESKN